MATTLQQLIDEVKASMRLLDQWGVAHATGDGVTFRFKLPDFPIIDLGSLSCTSQTEDGVLTEVLPSMYELDPRTGYFAFYSPPESKSVVQWVWRFAPVEDEEIVSILNMAIRYVAKEIKVPNQVDTSITTDLYVYEYEAPATATRLKKVELQYDDLDRWHPWIHWETLNIAGQLFVKFNRHPGIAKVRVHYDARPSLFEWPIMMIVDGSDPQNPVEVVPGIETVTKLPGDSRDALVAYAVWMLLLRVLNHRTRDDAAQHQKEEAAVTMRDLESRVSGAKTFFELQQARFASELEMGRIIP